MKIKYLPFFYVLLASVFAARYAIAQTQQDWMDCLAGDLRSPDVPIAGCSAVIKTGEGVLRRLAIAYNNRGVAYRLTLKYDKAIEDFNEAIRLEPKYANAFNNRGVAYRNMGDLDHALGDYDQAIRIKPDYYAAVYNRGLALTDRTEYAKAISDFKIVLAADPKNPLVLYRLGAVLVKAGDADAGNADLAEAKAIKPNIEEEIRQEGP